MSVASWCCKSFCVFPCVSFCTGHFVMVPLNMTYLHCLQYALFEHLFNLYWHIYIVYNILYLNISLIYFYTVHIYDDLSLWHLREIGVAWNLFHRQATVPVQAAVVCKHRMINYLVFVKLNINKYWHIKSILIWIILYYFCCCQNVFYVALRTVVFKASPNVACLPAHTLIHGVTPK